MKKIKFIIREIEKNGFIVERYKNIKRSIKVRNANEISELPNSVKKEIKSVAHSSEEFTGDITQKIILDVPNEENADNWGLGRIDKRRNPYFGSNGFFRTTYQSDLTGFGVRAFIIDSGVEIAHSEFENRAQRLFGGVDLNGHGTHVASNVAGKKHGVAKKAEIFAVQVLGEDNRGSFERIMDGMDSVIDEHDNGSDKPSVANMSLSGTVGAKDHPMFETANEMIENGIVLVVSAGNDGKDLNNFEDAFGNKLELTPAATTRAVTVGASDYSDNMVYFSNHGNLVNILAPGSGIKGADLNNSESVSSGTSFSSPLVAGIFCLLLEGKNKLTNSNEVENIVQELIDRSTKEAIDLNGR